MFLFTKEINILKISEENFVKTRQWLLLLFNHFDNIDAQKNHVRSLLSFMMKL